MSDSTNGAARFAHLAVYDIKASTARFPLDKYFPVLKGAYLQVRPATNANKDWLAAVVQYEQEHPTEDNETVMQGRDRENAMALELYPGLVVTEMCNVVDAAGDPVASNLHEIAEFLQQIPDWVFERLRIFCQRPESFVKANLNAAKTAKKS